MLSALFWDVYAAFSGNFLPTFRNNLSVPSSWVKNLGFLTLEDGAMLTSYKRANLICISCFNAK